MKILSFLFVIPVMAIALPADQLLSRSKGPGYFHVMEAWNGQSGTHSSAIGISLVMSSVYNCTGFLDNLDMGISGKSVDAAAGHLASWFHSNNGICGKKDLDFWLNNTDSQKPTFNVFQSNTTEQISTCSVNIPIDSVFGCTNSQSQEISFSEQLLCSGSLCQGTNS